MPPEDGPGDQSATPAERGPGLRRDVADVRLAGAAQASAAPDGTDEAAHRVMWLGARRGALWTFVLCAVVGFFALRWAYRVGRSRGIEIESKRALDKEFAIQLEPGPAGHYPGSQTVLISPLPAPERARELAEGVRAGDERRRVEARAVTRAPAAPSVRRGAEPGLPAAPSVRPRAEPGVPAAHAGDSWLFGPAECVRVVWPMEIVPAGADPSEGLEDAGGGPRRGAPRVVPLEGARFRLRQGANRFCRPGAGLAEFAFELDRPAHVRVSIRCRYLDECGNSIRCTVDGEGTTVIGRRKVFGRWLWEGARRGFMLAPGIHRVTLSACEDGFEFDRVAVSVATPGPPAPPGVLTAAQLAARVARGAGGDPGRAEATPPPVFESLPRAAPTLPGVGAVEAQAFATGSVVVGRGHANTLAVYVRRNGPGPVTGFVRVRCPYAGLYRMGAFRLDGGERARLMAFDLDLRPGPRYLMPLRCEVTANGETVLSQRIDFVRPLPWAFLGPFPDPEGKGIDLDLPPDGLRAVLHTLPEVDGRKWKVVEDGSCYDSFGVVDLNKAFGMANVPWRKKDPDSRRFVGYAVTAIGSGGSRHDTLAFAADDAMRVWLNGKPFLSVDNRTPLETSRQVVGTRLRPGPNFFAFKVAQRGFYWQVLFEPDNSMPYGRTENLSPFPAARWKQPVPVRPPRVIVQ